MRKIYNLFTTPTQQKKRKQLESRIKQTEIRIYSAKHAKMSGTSVQLKEKIAEIDDDAQFLLAKLNLLLNKEKDIKKQ